MIGVQICEIFNFLPDSSNDSNYVIQLVYLFDAAYMPIIHVHSPRIAEYEKELIPRIYFTVKEPPWDPSTDEYSERETHMMDH